MLACIRGRRLGQYARIVQCAPPSLVALLSATALADKSYAATIAGDLDWLYGSSSFPDSHGLLDPQSHVLMWQRFILSFPNKFRLAVKVAEYLDSGAIQFLDKPPKHDSYACHLCECTFTDVQAYYGHMARIHKHRNPFKVRACGTQCLACLKDYHNREKLCHHLRYSSQRCANYYFNHIPVLSPDVLKSEDSTTAALTAKLKREGKDHKFAELPPVRHEGPLPDRDAPSVQLSNM